MHETVSDTWNPVLAMLRKEVGERRFDLWLKNASFNRLEGNVVQVDAPNIFVKEWLSQHYAPIIQSCIEREEGRRPELRFAVDPALMEEDRAAEGEAEAVSPPAPAKSASPADESTRLASLGLNPAFRFDNFVVGACNRLATSAAWAVIEEPGELYNPLFIYGSSGLGKSHILQAIAREFAARNPSRTVSYLSCERFVNGFIESLKHRQATAFRERFRNVDFLVIDDVHILSNKEATQEEFLHTFNAAFNRHRQIVMASDSHPNAIAKLRKELRGRFIAGLLGRLDPPSTRTRLDILRDKARRTPVEIPDEVLVFLAHNIRSNVRVLEGALTSLVARATLLQTPLTVPEAAKALRMFEAKTEKIFTLGDVEDAVLARFGIASTELHSKSRKRCFLVPRQVCMFLARRLTSHSLSEIGQYFGKRDHGTVLYAIRKVEENLGADPDLARLVKTLEETIRRPETWTDG